MDKKTIAVQQAAGGDVMGIVKRTKERGKYRIRIFRMGKQVRSYLHRGLAAAKRSMKAEVRVAAARANPTGRGPTAEEILAWGHQQAKAEGRLPHIWMGQFAMNHDPDFRPGGASFAEIEAAFVRAYRNSHRLNPEVQGHFPGMDSRPGAARAELRSAVSELASLRKQDRKKWPSKRAREDFARRIVEVIYDGLVGMAREMGSSGSLPLPPRSEWRGLIRSTLTDAGQVRIRRSPRKRDSEKARVFQKTLDWHLGIGSANLHGPFSRMFRVGRQTYDQLDTLAQLMSIILKGKIGGHSETWRRALYGG